MRCADAGGVRIAYDDERPRADDAVVFLGGWCNSGRSFFAPLAERLAARHRVIRLDWRGHGDSGRPAADFGHDELADDAMAVIQATGVRHVVPVSQAHGGWPALRLRRLLGNRVPRVVSLSWMVLDPPRRSWPCSRCWKTPGGGVRAWTTCSGVGWPAPRTRWPDGHAGRPAATALTCGHGQRARSQPTTASTAAPCARPWNSTRNLTCCTCTPSRAQCAFSCPSPSLSVTLSIGETLRPSHVRSIATDPLEASPAVSGPFA
jgi:pimeloyl-ACP methyl ester carboxylesterase